MVFSGAHTSTNQYMPDYLSLKNVIFPQKLTKMFVKKSWWGLFWADTHPPSKFGRNQLSNFPAIVLTTQPTIQQTVKDRVCSVEVTQYMGRFHHKMFLYDYKRRPL